MLLYSTIIIIVGCGGGGGGGGVGKQRPWSNSLIIKDLVVSYTFLASRSHFKPISSDFEGGLHFLHLGGEGGRL